MKWTLKHNGLVARVIAAPDNRTEALEAALEALGYELRVGGGVVSLRERYAPWRCNDGTFDFVDHDGEVCFCNLGNGRDEESAWAELEKKLKGAV